MPPTKPKRPPIEIVALAERFRRLAEPTRALVLLTLGDGERHVGALCVVVGCGSSTLSTRLTLMRLDGLVEGRRDGQRMFYALTESGRALASVVEALGG
jgi:DNA-binding HxlR family transcriptional regulator